MTSLIAVPPTLMERVEHIATSVVPRIRRVTLADNVDPIDGASRSPLTFGAALIEAVTSSAIEGIHASVTQAALAFWQPRHKHVTAAGRAVVAGLRATFNTFDETATYWDHREAHTLLMKGQGTPAYAGGYRDRNVQVADHVAPAPRRVAELMEDLADFVDEREATILHAAIAHAQFETIHPYPDGNGRIGRALLSAHLGVPVSRYLARYRQVYYDALRDYRLGDATPIVQIVSAAARDGFELIEETSEHDGLDDIDLSKHARNAAARLTEVPVGTRRQMLRSQARDMAAGFTELLREGVVAEVSVTGADTVYAYLPVAQPWARAADTNVGRTRTIYEGSWKRDLSVHM